MNQPELSAAPQTSTAAERTPLESWEQQWRSWQFLFTATLMALLLLAVGVDFFLWYQVKLVRKELKGTYAFMEDYQKNKEPLLRGLINGLQNLAPNHADVGQLIEKYGIKPAGINAAPASPAAPPPKAGH